MMISAMNPYYSVWPDKCTSRWDSDLAFDYTHLLAQEPFAAHIANCQPDLSSDPVQVADANNNDPAEGFDRQLYAIGYQPDDVDLRHDDLVKGLDLDRGFVGADSCLYLERDHQVLRAEEDADCGIFEAGFDSTQLMSVLTLAIVAILSFALIPLAWLLTRYFRAWRLGGSAFAASGVSASRTWTTQTSSPALVRGHRHRLSSSSRVRHRHGRRRTNVPTREGER
jgi:hypothetical protein